MPNMGFRGIYAAPNSALGGKIVSGDILPARRGNLFPSLDFSYLNPFDPYFEFTTFLLKAEGANTLQNYSFIDSSSSDLTVTRNGDVNQGSFSPYSYDDGYWGAYFDGTGDYLNLPINGAFQFGSGDFTIECWVYVDAATLTSGSNDAVLIELRSTGSSSTGFTFNMRASSTGFRLNVYTDGAANLAATTLAYNTWHHVAISRSGSTVRLFANGVVDLTVTKSNTFNDNPVPTIGASTLYSSSSLTGYISNFRIVKGTAVYTSAFTPSSAPLTAISGTSFLTCQSNIFKDNSTNALAIGLNGNVRILPFGPFNTSTSYSISGTGGSAYLDGTGDFLTVPYSTTNFDWWTSDYTLEYWAYPISLSTWSYFDGTRQRPIALGHMVNDTDANYWSLGPISDGTVRFYYFNGAAQTVTSTQTVNAGQWNHIAITKTSSGITIYVNGVASTTTAVSGTPQSSSGTPFTIGRHNNNAINGYVSNVRIVKGTAVYSSSFTPPSAPLTAITNTKLLLLTSNAGIVDASRKHNLYTVGNAQVSTNVFKYNKSLNLDGNGDYVNILSSPLLDFEAGDFTIEFWVRPGTNTGLYPTILGNVTGWSTGASGCRYNNTGAASKFTFHLNGAGDPFLTSTNTFATGSWYHYALTRSGNTFRLFINGNLEASSTSYTGSYNLGLGGTNIGWSAWDGSNGYFNGYVEDLRVTKGYARYTAAFTPPGVMNSQ